jgi:hypothetical protein
MLIALRMSLVTQSGHCEITILKKPTVPALWVGPVAPFARAQPCDRERIMKLS